MKKIVLLLVMLFIVSSFMIGCGKKEEVKQTSQPKQETKKDDANKELGQLFKLSDIKNKSQDEVNKILGNPVENKSENFTYKDTQVKADNCFINTYNKDKVKIEIFFIENKAARVTIIPLEKLIYPTADTKLFKLLGLEYEIAPICNNNVSKWDNIKDIYEISLFGKQGDTAIDYMYIVLDKKYR